MSVGMVERDGRAGWSEGAARPELQYDVIESLAWSRELEMNDISSQSLDNCPHSPVNNRPLPDDCVPELPPRGASSVTSHLLPGIALKAPIAMTCISNQLVLTIWATYPSIMQMLSPRIALLRG